MRVDTPDVSVPNSALCWKLEYESRPFTTNAERTWHHMKRAKHVKEWREAFFWLAKVAQIPPLKSVQVFVYPYHAGRGRKADCGAANPAAKAAIDGACVDGGIIPDDTAEYLTSITFFPPQKGKNAMEVVICGEPA